MYGLWTSCLILIMTYPGYLVWFPSFDFPYMGVVKSFYHLALFLAVQGPALPRYLKMPTKGVLALSTFYWIFFIIALLIKYSPIPIAAEIAFANFMKIVNSFLP